MPARSVRASSASQASSATSPSSLKVTATTRRGARGEVLPAASAPGNPGEHRLLEQTTAELDRLGFRPREVAVDGGFVPGATEQTLTALAPRRTFVSGRAEPGSRRTRKRLARYRGGAVDPGRPHQRAAEPGGQADIVQGPGDGVVSRCHVDRSLRSVVTQHPRLENSAGCGWRSMAAVQAGGRGFRVRRHGRRGRRGRSGAPATARWPARRAH
jgi:hypothetical protein